MTGHHRLVPLLVVLSCCAPSVACSSGEGLPAVDAPTAPALELTASEMRYDPANLAVGRGPVPVVLRNSGTVIHDLRIEGKPALLVEASPGQSATATWQLDKGRYRIYCSVSGHRSAGMRGVLEVR